MAQRGDYGRGKFRKDNLVAIAPSTAHFKMGLQDQKWVTDFDSLPLETARRYWAGEQTDSPMTECLLQGSFWVLGTAVRKRAYETLKNRYPNSLAMLELSRLAVEFGSDLGSISPWLVKDGDKARVTHIIRYSEEEGVDIFRKAIEKSKCGQTFAVNWVDLEPLCKGGINPELDQKFSVPDLRVFDHELRQDKVAELQDFVGLILRS
jgi:hypothetical protein